MLWVDQTVQGLNPLIKIPEGFWEITAEFSEKRSCLDVCIQNINIHVTLYNLERIVKRLRVTPRYLGNFFFDNWWLLPIHDRYYLVDPSTNEWKGS